LLSEFHLNSYFLREEGKFAGAWRVRVIEKAAEEGKVPNFVVRSPALMGPGTRSLSRRLEIRQLSVAKGFDVTSSDE